MILYRRYRFRLAPTPEQAARLAAWQNALRWLWNIALEQHLVMWVRRCKADRIYPSFFQQGKEVTELRAMLPWLADVPRGMCNRVLLDLDNAWKRCWSGGGRVGAPRFKSKHRGDLVSMGCPNSDDYEVQMAPAVDPLRRRGRERIGHLDFPKIGRIEGVFYRDFVGRQRSCALTFECGEWWCSILTEQEVADPVPSTKPPVAIDRGVVNVIADSDRRLVENPRFGERAAKQLARAQRAVKRKQKGSSNQKKAKLRVAKIQRRTARQREHFLHAESKHYAENHGVVIVEKLNVRGMTASAEGTIEEPGSNVRQKAGLNRSILDSGWGRFVEMVIYKTDATGGKVIAVPSQHSSQTCSACGCVDAASRRSQDTFICTTCGHFDNADLNAASVLLARGLKQIAEESSVTACGGCPATGPTKQERGAAKRRTKRHGVSQSSGDIRRSGPVVAPSSQ